jgi:hypothetical protein
MQRSPIILPTHATKAAAAMTVARGGWQNNQQRLMKLLYHFPKKNKLP